MADQFGINTEEPSSQPAAQVIKSKETKFWNPSDGITESDLKDMSFSIQEMVNKLKADPNAQIEAKVLCKNKEGTSISRMMTKQEFIESWEKNEKAKTFKEAFDNSDLGGGGGIGNDYTPLLGGPFSKQLYYYDYLQMHANSFFAINHDPILRSCVDIILNFVLGKGFRVDCDHPDGLIIWRSFEKVNKLQSLMRYYLREYLTYGENMVWWLPDGKTEVRYMAPKAQASQLGLIPRIKLIDPSTVWDYITMPEDIETRIAYVQVFPTQYQLYQGDLNGSRVPGSKFIYQQIPADQVDHYRSNCMSNEKRGRSLLFPVLGYAKRLRDTVDYAIIALQKQGAWAIDTEIDGNQTDINNYTQAIYSQGQFAPPGSEFVHTTKVKRTMLSNSGGKGGTNDAFKWCLDMICSGLGIPVTYLGTSESSGHSRAGSLVGTEPVAKKMEEHQAHLESVLQDMAQRLFKTFGIDAEIEVTFPEVITQDRSAKLKDLSLAESQGWISHSRAAEIAAKELNISNYDWAIEKVEIEGERKDEMAPDFMPLSAPPLQPFGTALGSSSAPAPGPGQEQTKNDSTTAVTSDEKRQIKRHA